MITLTTDFGLDDPFVGIMKGVLATRAPGVPVIDVTHGIPPQDVVAGALVLRHAVPWFPAGSVHVAVVDPGVGTSRRAICVDLGEALLLGPDNGLLSLAIPPARARHSVVVEDERFMLTPRSSTFHGRDVFAPVAAALATGTPPAALGPSCDDPVALALPPVRVADRQAEAAVVYVDRFGNLVTNVDDEALIRRVSAVAVGRARTGPVAPSYASVGRGEPVAVVNSWGHLEIAVRDGSAAARLEARVGSPVVLDLLR